MPNATSFRRGAFSAGWPSARFLSDFGVKIDASGLPYVVNFLNGAGGHGYGLENARRTASLYDGLHMTMVNTSMLTVVPGTPLYRALEKGLYAESTEKEKLEEIHELVRCLTNDTIFMNEHASNLFHVKCRIPEEKEAILAYKPATLPRAGLFAYRLR